jgi:hypothetical protein
MNRITDPNVLVELGIDPEGLVAWHFEDALTERDATRAVLDSLPFGSWLDDVVVLGSGAGIDGTILVARIGYSHS